MEKCESSKEKLDRKTTERNRRIHMKELCFKLTSLIPHHFKSSKDVVSQHDQLDQAVTYINQLTQRVDELKAKREIAMTNTCTNNNTRDTRLFGTYELPVVELKDLGSIFEVVLITGLEKNFMMHQVISVLEDEGADVVSASFYTLGAKVFHTFHAQVKVSRFGVDTSRVYQRLQELIS
ncbi:Transcription factor bHLH36 like [Actinidia chinensis var. chinensis]|uniref:Transcription factor bHLH36 like n=1 Tax=Actinidia chinensis var. chinensis TaxID=1590841 RepID=A0A2R6PE04_ACTCC|nr:Transcription factor bHLH36 like [Actinidia chinensis var. chinensis]